MNETLFYDSAPNLIDISIHLVAICNVKMPVGNHGVSTWIWFIFLKESVPVSYYFIVNDNKNNNLATEQDQKWSARDLSGERFLLLLTINWQNTSTLSFSKQLTIYMYLKSVRNQKKKQKNTRCDLFRELQSVGAHSVFPLDRGLSLSLTALSVNICTNLMP